MLVEHRRLDARPGAHVSADLFAQQAAENVGGGGQDRDGDVGDRRGRAVDEFAEQGRRVGEIEDPRASGGDRDDQPDNVFGGSLGRAFAVSMRPCRA
jgi:hypothetical protein